MPECKQYSRWVCNRAFDCPHAGADCLNCLIFLKPNCLFCYFNPARTHAPCVETLKVLDMAVLKISLTDPDFIKKFDVEVKEFMKKGGVSNA